MTSVLKNYKDDTDLLSFIPQIDPIITPEYTISNSDFGKTITLNKPYFKDNGSYVYTRFVMSNCTRLIIEHPIIITKDSISPSIETIIINSRLYGKIPNTVKKICIEGLSIFNKTQILYNLPVFLTHLVIKAFNLSSFSQYLPHTLQYIDIHKTNISNEYYLNYLPPSTHTIYIPRNCYSIYFNNLKNKIIRYLNCDNYPPLLHTIQFNDLFNLSINNLPLYTHTILFKSYSQFFKTLKYIPPNLKHLALGDLWKQYILGPDEIIRFLYKHKTITTLELSWLQQKDIPIYNKAIMEFICNSDKFNCCNTCYHKRNPSGQNIHKCYPSYILRKYIRPHKSRQLNL